MNLDSQAPTPLALADPSAPLPLQWAHEPGGFLWWYLDACDDAGDGLTLIWSFGLPFLPGSRRQTPGGPQPRPADRPALSLALYRGGRQVDYALQEHRPADIAWSDGGATVHFGNSRIRTSRVGAELHLEISLDLVVPGSDRRLTGRITLVGPGACLAGVHPDEGPHRWCPLVGPARVEAQLETAAGPFTFEGWGYHDRNGSRVGLHTLGIKEWAWGRIVEPNQTWIYYALWPEEGAPLSWSVTLDRRGQLRRDRSAALVEGAPRRARYGMVHRPLQVGGRSIATRRLLEDGPFYLRSLVEVDGAIGVGEWVRPDRIDLPHHRPFVRMRVHRLGAKNSPWLPLFNGPSGDRWARLWRSL